MRLLLVVSVVLSIFHSAYAADDAAAKLGLHHESELGYIVVGGNAKSQSFSGKQGTWYQWDRDMLKLSGHYLSTRAQNQNTKVVEGTAENWSAVLREEHAYIPEKFSVFAQVGATGDRFIGVDLGMGYDLGVKYYWIADDTIKFFSEVGYRYLDEDLRIGTIESTKESHFLRLFSQVDYIYSPTINFGVQAEYLPDMKDSDNYRLNYSPYMLAILNQTFSLKFSYEGQYRNLPVAGNLRTDYRHVTALIAKF